MIDQQANKMTDEQRINGNQTTFDESDQHDDIQPKNRTKRTSPKKAKPSRKQAPHSSPRREEPAAQQEQQSPTHETPQKAKTRAARREIDTFEEEQAVQKAPRKEPRTARYVRIDDVRMNLARKFKEGI